MSILIGSNFISLFIPSKVAKKITSYLLGNPPVSPKERKTVLLHQFYFYIIWITQWIMPPFLILFLDIVCGYWGSD
jgi:hypothetical protein